MTSFAYRVHPSPVGDILIVTAAEAIVTLHPLTAPLGSEMARLSVSLQAVPEHDEAAGGDIDEQLDEYFAGERRTFEVDLDWRLVGGFTRTALDAVRDIPYAETASYGEIAIRAGSPRAARAVGTACATTPFSIVVPVHRVVRADGSMGLYGRHPEIKRFLVDLEQSTEARGAGE